MKIKLSAKQQKIIILTAIFVSIVLMNLLVPLLGDDFNYSFGLNGRLQNVGDIIQKQYWHYFNWGGRTIAHFLAELFLLMPKSVFSISNALIYTLLIYLIYKYTINDKERPINLILTEKKSKINYKEKNR